MMNAMEATRRPGLSRRVLLAGGMLTLTLVASTGVRACMPSAKDVPKMTIPNPDLMPSRFTLPAGGGIEFSVPHLQGFVVKTSGGLRLASKPGDPLLKIDSDPYAGNQVATLSIALGAHVKSAEVTIERYVPPKPAPLKADLTDPQQLPTEPFTMNYYTELEVLARSDTAEVQLRFGESNWKAVEQEYDSVVRLFRGIYRVKDLDLSAAVREAGSRRADVVVVRTYEAKAQRTGLIIREIPTPTC